MFKRKSKNSVAYTRVDHVPLAAQEPSSGATAAARSIGESLKRAYPQVYGQTLLQPDDETPSQQPQSSSLLKPNSSLLFKSELAPQAALRSNSLTEQRTTNLASRLLPSNGSGFVGESTRLSALGGANEARLCDLKLQHQPQVSATGQSTKMIKKYIPTPNGIQVVEVPESSYKQELARSNSMRSGSFVRTGLLTRSISRASLLTASGSRTLKPQSQKLPRKSAASLRLSSIVSEPSIAEEPDFAADNEETQRIQESAFLKAEIEKEKQRAHDLEQQRLEYELLESLRANNDRMYRELQTLREKDMPEVSPSPSSTVDPSVLTKSPFLTSHFVDFSTVEAEEGDDEEEDVPITSTPHAVDEVDLKRAQIGNSFSANHNSFVEEAYSLSGSSSHDERPSALEVIDTYTDKNAQKDAFANGALTSTALEEGVTDVILDDGKPLDNINGSKEFCIEDVAAEPFNSPKLNLSQLDSLAVPSNTDAGLQRAVLPTFDPVPEVIESAANTNLALSIRSNLSLDSKSKPIKSAMKKSKANYTSSKKGVANPAEQAYISLTTAENTRLNSKLSASQMSESTLNPLTSAKSTPESAASTLQKRMAQQTLRKLANPQGLSNRTNKSKRGSELMQADNPGASGGRMSARIFRNEPRAIAPHQASNNQNVSPSRQRAAALYAKAIARPVSTFEPTLRRKSSFSREPGHLDADAADRPAKGHMTTLRVSSQKGSNDLMGPGAYPSQNPASSSQTFGKRDDSQSKSNQTKTSQIKPLPQSFVSNDISCHHDSSSALSNNVSTNRDNSTSHGEFKSKFIKSDGESVASVGAFCKPSHLEDSDDGTSVTSPPVQQYTLRNSIIQPVNVKGKSSKKNAKPGKKRKSFLKKIFGMN